VLISKSNQNFYCTYNQNFIVHTIRIFIVREFFIVRKIFIETQIDHQMTY